MNTQYYQLRCYILFFAGLFSCSLLSAQPTDLVKTQGITSPLHVAHTGQIIFTDRSIPASELKEANFLQTYTLTNKSNLFITVFMGNSLTNYMHRVAPALPADSLTKKGGYQFALYIDGRLIYQSNILGAPYPIIKDTETVVSKPLIDNAHEGSWWSQSYWNRFMRNGGDSTLTEGKHLLNMEIRPYLQTATGLATGDLIASGKLNLVVNRKPVINIDTIRLNRVTAYDGFGVSTEKFDTRKIRELKGNINEGVFKKISSIVVIKNGKLLIEEYFNGASRNTLHDTRSVGKSFASSLTGIAIGEGHLKNEDQELKAFYDLQSFAHYAPEKEHVAIKDLLTMSSVFDGDDNNAESPGNEENMYPTPDWVKFTLDLPVNLIRPREEWHYFTAGVLLLGDILNKTVPGGLEQYASERLFKPLHITDYQWGYTPQKVPNTAGGLRMKALDFAKYGQLYQNGGQWQGQQLIPGEWVRKTFTPHRAVTGRKEEYYGYLFWNKKYTVNGQAYETFYCAGNGGNKIFVFKGQPLVIIVTATAYGTAYAHPQVDKMMQEYILPAVLGR
jgi:CubicO group peptidase (beta-lactamase class C family)